MPCTIWKTSCKTKKCYTEDVFNTYSRGLQYVFSKTNVFWVDSDFKISLNFPGNFAFLIFIVLELFTHEFYKFLKKISFLLTYFIVSVCLETNTSVFENAHISKTNCSNVKPCEGKCTERFGNLHQCTFKVKSLIISNNNENLQKNPSCIFQFPPHNTLLH